MTRPFVRLGLAACAMSGALPAGAHAGPFLPPQSVSGPVTRVDDQSAAATGAGGTSAIAYSAVPRFVRGEGGGSTDDWTIWVAAREPGQARFGAPEPVVIPSTPRGMDVHRLELGVDAQGGITLVFWVSQAEAYPGGQPDIFVVTRPAGGTWGAPQYIATQNADVDSGDATSPELRVAASGRAFLLVEDGLFERPAGATQFTAVPGTAGVRHVALNARGEGAALVYGPKVTSTDALDQVSVRVSPAGGPLGAALPLGGIGSGYPDNDRSALAVTPDGTVVATWESTADAQAGEGVAVAVRPGGAGSSAAAWNTTRSVNTNPDGDRYGFDLSADPVSASQVAVAWSEPAELDAPTGGGQFERVFPGPATRTPIPKQQYDGRAVSAGTGGSLVAVDDPTSISVRPTLGAAFGAPQRLPIDPSIGGVPVRSRISLDDEGNGFVRVQTTGGGADQVTVNPYDPVPPKIASVKATTAKAGKPMALTATATDRMSAPSLTWTFGDGRTTGRGNAVVHTYANAGPYVVKVRARDAAGNTTTTNKLVLVTK